MAHRQPPKKALFLKELRKVPIVGIACQRVGLSRSTIYRWMEEDEVFSEQVRTSREEGVDSVNDMAESQLIKGIKEGKMPSITFWLRHNSPTYKSQSARDRSKKSIWDRQPVKALVEFIGFDPGTDFEK